MLMNMIKQVGFIFLEIYLLIIKWALFSVMSFRPVKMMDKFIEAHLKAANCYENARSFFSAAKSYEQVALAAKEKNDWDTMVKYFEKACLYFREHGVPDTAALTYNRGAR